MKGIVLAGGSGTRLYPVTRVVNKQLLPLYDKPMVYYSISALMFAGIRDILLITTPDALSQFQKLLGDGGAFGLRVTYAKQDRPRGLAEAFIIGRDFVGADRCALALGDNVFFGHDFPDLVKSAAARESGATIFAYCVSDPGRYGVVEFNDGNRVVSLEEKPARPRSNWAVTGLYFYDNCVLDIAARIRLSARGELEITDVNRAYLELGALRVEKMGRGYAWLDTGTPESLIQAAQFIQTIEQRQGQKIACLEEIALRLGYIDMATFERRAEELASSSYGEYLRQVAKDFRA